MIMTNVKTMAVILIASFILQTAYGAQYCGKTALNTVALNLMPCLGATKSAHSNVPSACCTQVKKFLAMPACICAVFLSPIAKEAGMNPAIAITIPKRCKIVNRHAGQKCGSKFFSSSFSSLFLFTFSSLSPSPSHSYCHWIISSISHCLFLCWCCVGYIVPWIEQKVNLTTTYVFLLLIPL